MPIDDQDRTPDLRSYPEGATPAERIAADVSRYMSEIGSFYTHGGLNGVASAFADACHRQGVCAKILDYELFFAASQTQTIAVANGPGWTCSLVIFEGRRVGVVMPGLVPALIDRAETAERELRAERSVRADMDKQFGRTLDALDARRHGDDESLPSSARKIIDEVERLRARVEVTDEDIAAAGLGDPTLCDRSSAIGAWLTTNGFEEVRHGDPDFRRAGLWHAGEHVIACSAMAHAWIINALARHLGRAPLDVLDEIVAIEVPS